MYIVTNTEESRHRSFYIGDQLIIFHPWVPTRVSPEEVKILMNDQRFWQLRVTETFSVEQEK